MKLNEFWAKTTPFQSVPTHALVSGHVAQVLLETYLSEGSRNLLCEDLQLGAESLSAFVGYLVSLHDIGKIEYSFQKKDENLKNLPFEELLLPSVRHEKTSEACLKQIWRKLGEDRVAVYHLSRIIGAHHQGKTGGGNFKEGSVWHDYQRELETLMRKHFAPLDQEKALPLMRKYGESPACALLLGLMVLSDWISSGVTFQDAENWIGEPNAKDRIKIKADDFLERSGLKPSRILWPVSFSELWRGIPVKGRRPLQINIEELLCKRDDMPLLTLLEAPMGEGKTEAGLYAGIQMAKGWKADGFYVAMPTSATANQMVGRVQKLLDDHGQAKDVRLLHSMAWLEKTESFGESSLDERDEVATWLAPVKRGLLGQYAVGTIDQAMFAATNVKYGVLRLFGLSNKVLIVDEVHSYDAYMDEIIIRLLEWCKALQIPVVMLSATLSPGMKKKLLKPYTEKTLSEGYPLITMVDAQGEVTESIVHGTSHHLEVSVDLMPLLGCPEKIAQQAIEMVRAGGCLCVLMNTVREAQEVYREIKKNYAGDCLLFHAQFPMERRSELERDCIRRYGKDKSQRPERSILVATQVVEQSLDVDFDAMMTAAAPIDLIFQRIGRVHRHSDTKRPDSFHRARVTVLFPENGDYGASAYVYPSCLLRRTIELLGGREKVSIPGDIAGLVKAGYDAGSSASPEEVKEWLENLVKQQVQAGASQQFLINPPDKDYTPMIDNVLYEDEEESFQLSAKTRLSEPTIRIAILSPDWIDKIEPFLVNRDGKQMAKVRSREMAEAIMKQTLSVPIRRLGGSVKELPVIQGASLLRGVFILCEMNGCVHLPNSRIMRIDRESGLVIEEGEV